MKTIDAFKEYVKEVTSRENYVQPIAYGLGIRRRKNGKVLDVNFPLINWESNFGTAAVLIDAVDYDQNTNGFNVVSKSQLEKAFDKFAAFHNEIDAHANIANIQLLKDHMNQPEGIYQEIDVIAFFLFDENIAVESAEEGYFKLQCLSQLHVKPHGLSLEGVFGKLTNVAWTNKGPILPEDVNTERIKATFKGEELKVSHLDKFPYMVDYHVPNGVRIASGSQVRLGAHTAEGTTVMPAGYVNFNAGTLGNAMVEGRISAGVVVGNNSDLGGGVSIMGTLSGGNNHVISIGEKCLLGANAGTGISLGYGCTIAAGVYVTAAAKVWMYNENKEPINLKGKVVEEGENIVKGMELSGKEHLLFIQDSTNGHLICRPNTKTIELNKNLHTKD